MQMHPPLSILRRTGSCRTALRSSLAPRALAAAASVALAAGCSPAPTPDAAPPAADAAGTVTEATPTASPPADRTVYRCGDTYAFTAVPHERGVTLMLPDRTVELPQVAAASGARYEGEGIVFWSQAGRARLQTPSATHADCTGEPADGPWEAARLLGGDYRAVGQEPGWTVDVQEGRAIRFETDYGETRVTVPAPVAQVDGARTTYRARTDAHEVVVRIERTPCEDVMSGEPFPTTATVWLDGREHRGCGRELGAGAGQLRGSVAYRERIALPPEAIVRVRLVDLGGGVGRAPLAETRFVADGRQVPLPFTVDYRTADLREGGRYGLEARIETDGQTMFATPEPVPVSLPHGAPVELMLTRGTG